MSRRLAELSGPAAAARLTESSIIVVPTGAVEQHGPHLPLITDALIAESVAGAAVERAAEAGLDVWVLPTVPYTKSDEHSWSPTTVWLDADAAFRMFVAIGGSLAGSGAGTLVFANGHGGNTALLQVVLREIRRHHGLRTFLMPTLISVPGPNGEDADERGLWIHGGAAETAVIMHLRPDLVDLSACERWVPDSVAEHELIGFNNKPISFGWLSDDFNPAGVIGDPRRANAVYGELVFERSVQRAVEGLAEIARFEIAVRR
jgi:creatinine amidohydrolase